jgi:pimeloyl-ACP methyl ester carboxylesterase
MEALNMTFHGADGNLLAADVFAPDNTTPEDADHVVLLMHGGGQTRHSWGGTAKRLAARGLTAITVDARGHGASDWLEDKSYTFDHYARDVIALATEIREKFGKRPICVGASLGGLSSMLAQTMAGQELLEALILVDITPRMDVNGVAKILGFMSEKMHHGFDTVEDAAVAIAAYLPDRKKPKSLEGLQKNLRLDEDGRWRWHWDPGFIDGPLSINTLSDNFQQNMLDAAADLNIPTLLVRGGKSELVSKEHAQEFLTLAPHARFVDVSDAGHMVAGDKNDAFTNAIVDFLDEVIDGKA